MSKGDPIQLAAGLHIAEKWLERWQALGGALDEPKVETHVCGSIRRKERMIRDIDILVLDSEMHGKFERGTMFEGVELNLCFMRKEHEGAGLLFLTGDYRFNIGLRTIAKRQDMKLNRYGLWKDDKIIASKTEEEIFEALERDYVPPEKRKSPDGQKGIMVPSSKIGTKYEVFIEDLHGFYFCECRGFQFRRSCRHLREAEMIV